MIWLILLFFFSFLYMETVYHIGCFGFAGANPLIAVFLWVFLAGLSSLLCGFLRKRKNKVVLWVLLGLQYALFAAQLVYMKIFKQPLLMAAVTNAGADAVTNYWREALTGILNASGWLLLMALPFVACGWIQYQYTVSLKNHSRKERLRELIVMGVGIAGYVLVLVIGGATKAEYHEAYTGFYDPEGVISTYGVTPSIVRDLGNGFFDENDSLDTWQDLDAYVQEPVVSVPDTPTTDVSSGDEAGDGSGNINFEVPEMPVIDLSPNVLPVDFDYLIENAESEEIKDLAMYMQSMTPTNRNEYTGMFEGYNLIFLTAEGFSPYAVDENLTPTLYKLVNSGFVMENYYVPLWQTSTSDGEYINLSGLIPDQQFSMKRSAKNDMAFSLAEFFAKEGVKSYAYHNNSLSYYDRHLSHPNMGYNFKACKIGNLSEKEWGGQVFEMENAGYWPASDLNMMEATIPEYINEDRFHVYYLTVSGHMNYNFSGNRMSSKHKEDVANLPYSEEGRAYIACNMELDLALEYLIEQLDQAGKLENTVICLSADHYPYGMEIANLEELAGKPLEGSLDIYRNNLILWNSKMETVKVSKPASCLDLVPTLLNLFGFEYDSRLYAGKDILSTSAPLVVFADRSFITDRVAYNKKAKTTTYAEGFEEDEEYYQAVKSQVKSLYNYSAGILNNNFYHYVEQALPEEYHSKIDPEWIAPHPKVEKPKVEESQPAASEADDEVVDEPVG